MQPTSVVATATAAFGAQWTLGQDDTGTWMIARKWMGRDSHFGAAPSKKGSVQYFDSEKDARDYFTQYTTPIIAEESN
jgi:hypothetical protein